MNDVLQEKLYDAKRALDKAARECLQNKPGAAEAADHAFACVMALQTIAKAQREGVPQ